MEIENNNNIQSSLEGIAEERYLTFWVGQQLFGISTSDVVQIVGMEKIVPLPDTPHYVRGVISLRGEIFPVIDMQLRLGSRETTITDRTCIIITQIHGKGHGFIVDEVDEVLDIKPEQIIAPPEIKYTSTNDYLIGIGQLPSNQTKKERLVLIIKVSMLIEKMSTEVVDAMLVG